MTDSDTEILAVTSHHSWERHKNREKAVKRALDRTSYVNEGDTVEVQLYEVEPETIMTQSGHIGVEMDEKDVNGNPKLRKSEPFNELEKLEYNCTEDNGVNKSFEEIEA